MLKPNMMTRMDICKTPISGESIARSPRYEYEYEYVRYDLKSIKYSSFILVGRPFQPVMINQEMKLAFLKIAKAAASSTT